MDIISKPQTWNANARAISLENQATDRVTGSGRIVILPTPAPPGVGLVTLLEHLILSTYRALGIDQLTSTAIALLGRMFSHPIPRCPPIHYIHNAQTLDRPLSKPSLRRRYVRKAR